MDNTLIINENELKELNTMVPEKYILNGLTVYRYTNIIFDGDTGSAYSIDKPYIHKEGKGVADLKFISGVNGDLKGEAEALVSIIKEYKNPPLDISKNNINISPGVREQIKQARVKAYEGFSPAQLEKALDRLITKMK